MDIIRDAICEALVDCDSCIVDYIYQYIVTGENDWDFIYVFLSEIGMSEPEKIIERLYAIQETHASYSKNTALAINERKILEEKKDEDERIQEAEQPDCITCDSSIKKRILKDYDLRPVASSQGLPPVLDLVEYLQKRDKKSQKQTRFRDSCVVHDKEI
jgi:spore cortex formation protein SpoVR/YcgB (stage V sporulation)